VVGHGKTGFLWGKIGIVSEMEQDKDIVSIEFLCKVAYWVSLGTKVDDLE